MDTERDYEILVIEDGKFYQDDLVHTLQDFYKVIVADNGAKAMEILEKRKPDLILLDIVLPDVNGFDLLKKIKEAEATNDIPIIVITGLGDDSDEEKGLLLGAVDYIKKPFNQTIVRARVRTHIQILHHIHTIEQLSFLDALTELPNRRKFDYQIEYEWTRAIRRGTSLCLLLMDLDNFKTYNDSYGHSQGDVMLQTVAEVLKDSLKHPTDIPCRWGGEEFAVLLPETQLDEAVVLAEKIRMQIEKKPILCINQKSPTYMTVSIGAACMRPSANDPLRMLLEKADKMLYKAKENGRNQVQF